MPVLVPQSLVLHERGPNLNLLDNSIPTRPTQIGCKFTKHIPKEHVSQPSTAPPAWQTLHPPQKLNAQPQVSHSQTSHPTGKAPSSTASTKRGPTTLTPSSSSIQAPSPHTSVAIRDALAGVNIPLRGGAYKQRARAGGVSASQLFERQGGTGYKRVSLELLEYGIFVLLKLFRGCPIDEPVVRQIHMISS